MACQNLFKEAVDLGFTIAFRFYGRYPETGRSYYKPPCCNVPGNETDDGENRPAEKRIISSRRRPSLMQSLQLPNNLSVLWLPNLESASEFYCELISFFPLRKSSFQIVSSSWSFRPIVSCLLERRRWWPWAVVKRSSRLVNMIWHYNSCVFCFFALVLSSSIWSSSLSKPSKCRRPLNSPSNFFSLSRGQIKLAAKL